MKGKEEICLDVNNMLLLPQPRSKEPRNDTASSHGKIRHVSSIYPQADIGAIKQVRFDSSSRAALPSRVATKSLTSSAAVADLYGQLLQISLGVYILLHKKTQDTIRL